HERPHAPSCHRLFPARLGSIDGSGALRPEIPSITTQLSDRRTRRYTARWELGRLPEWRARYGLDGDGALERGVERVGGGGGGAGRGPTAALDAAGVRTAR